MVDTLPTPDHSTNAMAMRPCGPACINLTTSGSAMAAA
jgi:hypothetical protein